MIYENKAKKEFKENKKTMAMTQSGVTHIRVQSLVLLSRSSFNAMPKARTLGLDFAPSKLAPSHHVTYLSVPMIT
jgi:hypothetical protein